MNKKFSLLYLVVFLMLIFIFFLLIYFNTFSSLSLKITDNFYGGKEALDNIVIVKIDDESINKIGRWPWNRTTLADILLKAKDARVIGLDISFLEATNDDEKLRNTLNSMDNVVLAAEIINSTLQKPVFDADFGYVNLVTDRDGITRSVDVNYSLKVLPLAFEIYKKSWDKDAIFPNTRFYINFISEPESFNSISA